MIAGRGPWTAASLVASLVVTVAAVAALPDAARCVVLPFYLVLPSFTQFLFLI